MTWINRLYIFFIGIILSITTGYGLAAFYPEPKMPLYPAAKPYISTPRSCFDTPEAQNSPECVGYLEKEKGEHSEDIKKQEEYQKKMEEYRNTNASYTRTAVFVGIAVGTFYALLGLSMLKFSKLISNGLVLAGVLTSVFTRLLVKFASLGADVSGTSAADKSGYIQFAVLVLLSIGVLVAGKTALKDEGSSRK